MNDIELFPATMLLILVNVLFSISGFQSREVFTRYMFDVYSITKFKDYKRLITSGVLHADYMHLIFNMYVLYEFGRVVETFFGTATFVIMYAASLIVGDLLALLIHKNNTSYTAVGASGAVSGILFAYISVLPFSSLRFILIPIDIPAFVMGIGYVLISIYGIKSQRDNIGHEAHLGGAVTGMLIAIVSVPAILQQNFEVIALILIPAILFIYQTYKKNR